MIYAIDFDGTIVEDRYPEIGELKPEAEKFIHEIQRRGDKWILWTMRAGEKLDKAVKFLESHGLKPDAVNDNLPEVKADWLENPNPRKIFADVYIDDRNAGGLKWPDFLLADIPNWSIMKQESSQGNGVGVVTEIYAKTEETNGMIRPMKGFTK